MLGQLCVLLSCQLSAQLIPQIAKDDELTQEAPVLLQHFLRWRVALVLVKLRGAEGLTARQTWNQGTRGRFEAQTPISQSALTDCARERARECVIFGVVRCREPENRSSLGEIV